MAVHGRPTPQPNVTDADGPRFVDVALDDYTNADANPYVASHRTYGATCLPASEAPKFRGKWGERFGQEAPLHVEIGAGNGIFLAEHARRNPQWNLLGIELRYKRVVLCARKIDASSLGNALACRYHAAYLDDLFLENSLSGIYVNHPDPWSKSRHEKNRLISRWFLEDCARFLKPGGWLRMKSDYRDNIERVPSLLAHDADGQPQPVLPLHVTGRSNDVITGPAPWPDDIETNFQAKFRRKGEPVYAIQLVRI